MACLALSACEDDFGVDVPRYSDKIAFGVNVEADAGRSASRAGDIEATQDVYVTKFDGTFRDKPLYLHTIITDSIPIDIKTPKSVENSRGSMRDETHVADMGVSAVVWDTDVWSDDATSNILYFHNVNVSVGYNSNDGKYYGETSYYWPSAHKSIRFFAYSPYQEDFFIENEAKSPSFDYEVPVKASEQVDLLVASTEKAGSAKEVVEMPFGHALTAVQFKVAKDVPNITISSIKINNIKYKGTYTYDYNSSFDLNDDTDDVKCTEAGTWKTTADVWESYDVPFTGLAEGEELQVGANTSGVTINYGEDVLMMMPQEFSAAEIVVVLYDEIVKQESTITVSLDGHAWEKGKHVIYEISASDINIVYYLTMNLAHSSNPGYTYNDVNFRDEALKIKSPYFGKLGKYRVASYRSTTRGGKTLYEKVAWKLKSWVEIDAGGNPVGDPTLATDAVPNPKWLDIFTPRGSGPVSLNKETGAMTPEVLDYGLLPNLTDVGVNYPTGQNVAVLCDIISTSASPSINLNGRGSKGTIENPEDLSNPGNTIGSPQETANSYVITNPGYYAIPLVYGNAYTNGAINEKAWNKSASKVEKNVTKVPKGGGDATLPYVVLGEFLDHMGRAIKGPWIADQENTHTDVDYTPATASIVWQDEPCLVTGLKLIKDESGRDYMQLCINRLSICEGNAVIAVKNAGGTILWSWHIWVTNNITPKDASSEKVLTNNNNTKPNGLAGKDFTVLNTYFGYCNGELKTYSARKYRLNFVQVDNNGEEIEGSATNYIDVVQAEGSTTTKDNVPYYQWGRKDPMLPMGDLNNDKIYYYDDRTQNTNYNVDIVDASVLDWGTAGRTVAFSIQNPGKYISMNGYHQYGSTNEKYQTYSTSLIVKNWCKENIINLWNANCKELPFFVYDSMENGYDTSDFFADMNIEGNNGAHVQKTIYDPCPPGYEMPRIDAFTGFTYDGTNSTPFYTYPVTSTNDGGESVDVTFGSTNGEPNYANITSGLDYSYQRWTVTTRRTNMNSLLDIYNYDTSFDDYYLQQDGYANNAFPFGVFFFCKPMKAEFINKDNKFYSGNTAYTYADGTNIDQVKEAYIQAHDDTYDDTGGMYYMQAMGHRGAAGTMSSYNDFGNALTSSVACIQWYALGTNNVAFQFEGMRLCYIRKSTNRLGRGTMRTFSSSSQDLAFPIIPARTGYNPAN